MKKKLFHFKNGYQIQNVFTAESNLSMPYQKVQVEKYYDAYFAIWPKIANLNYKQSVWKFLFFFKILCMFHGNNGETKSCLHAIKTRKHL